MNRSGYISSSKYQFVNNSILYSAFALDRDFGLFASYSNKMTGQMHYAIQGSVTSGEGRNFEPEKNSGLAYIGRMVIYPLGLFKNGGEMSEGDIEHENRPKLMLAGVYAYNHNARRTNGQWGVVLRDNAERNLSNLYFDLLFKYSGFAFAADYMSRLCDRPIVLTSLPGGNDQFLMVGKGLNLQASYTFRGLWEAALRFTQVDPSDKIHHLLHYDRERQCTVGVTRYLNGHLVKLQLDAGFDRKRMMMGSDVSYWIGRFQVEIGI